MSRGERGKCVPGPAVHRTPGELLPDTTPLLEGERDATVEAAVANRTGPFWFHWSGAWSRLAPNDDPVDTSDR